MNWHFVRTFDGPHSHSAHHSNETFLSFFFFLLQKLIILQRVLSTIAALFSPLLSLPVHRFHNEVANDCNAFMIPLDFLCAHTDIPTHFCRSTLTILFRWKNILNHNSAQHALLTLRMVQKTHTERERES